MLGILKKHLAKIFLISLIFLTFLPVASAWTPPIGLPGGTFYLNILEDAHVSIDDPDTNYGDYQNMTINGAGTTTRTISYFMINVSSIPFYVNWAKLELYCVHFYGWGSTLSAYNTTTNWHEINITWNNMPALGTLQDGEQPVAYNGENGQPTYLDITDAIISAQANEQENVSIAVICDTINSGTVYPSTEDYTYNYYNRVTYYPSSAAIPETLATPYPTNTPPTQTENQNAFFQIIVPIACIAIPALIMAVYLGKWGFITGATLGATFGYIALPTYVPFYIPLFAGLGVVAIILTSGGN